MIVCVCNLCIVADERLPHTNGDNMKLFYSPASPYVRKVMVLAHEKKIVDRIEQVNTSASPVKTNDVLLAHNPLGKLPCLVLKNGRALFDSSVITAYVDSLSEPHINPDAGPDRFDALTLEALADGMLDACLLMRYESTLRPPDRFWQDWYDGQMAKVDHGLDLLEQRWMPALNGKINIGIIAVACALGYLDFRFIDKKWRDTRPHLSEFCAKIGERPSMQATRPAA
jgi:glutathione S-transferase